MSDHWVLEVELASPQVRRASVREPTVSCERIREVDPRLGMGRHAIDTVLVERERSNHISSPLVGCGGVRTRETRCRRVGEILVPCRRCLGPAFLTLEDQCPDPVDEGVLRGTLDERLRHGPRLVQAPVVKRPFGSSERWRHRIEMLAAEGGRPSTTKQCAVEHGQACQNGESSQATVHGSRAAVQVRARRASSPRMKVRFSARACSATPTRTGRSAVRS